MRKALLFLLLTIVTAGAGACGGVSVACGNGSAGCAGSTDAVVSDLQVDIPRFEFDPSQPNMMRARNLWLKSGDGLEAAWNSFIFYEATPGATCNATNHSSAPPACQICDLFNFQPAQCFARIPDGTVEYLQVSSTAGFLPEMEKEITGHLSDVMSVKNGVFPFHLARNATVTLSSALAGRGVLANSMAFVLSDTDGPQCVSYPLERIDTSAWLDQSHLDGGVVLYSGRVPMAEGMLQDNFSKRLEISSIQINQGKPDSSPGLCQATAGAARPSRIVAVSGPTTTSIFPHDNHNCHADFSTDNGNFDISRCTDLLPDALPAFLKSSTQTTENLLSWVAEYRPSEGGMPPEPANGALNIQFVIQTSRSH